MKFTKFFSEQTVHPFFSLQKEKYYHFNPAVLDSADQFIILKGYWHSEKYFAGIEHIIRDELKFTKVTGQQFAIYKSEVEKSPISVSVHVRRGDYVHHPEFSKTFGFIGLEYYDSAIAEIEERYPDARYFVFTDDPAWVKVNLKLKPNTVYVENNGPDADIDDLHLMSLCAHNIIANSSFSWWGAWLNNNSQKIVIAPKKWFKNQPEWDTKDLLPDSWLAI
ncbi:alpha-1,2-fucosyltransferase [Pedobacter deserti]|uniref:alpha-1,2-fucosyltransferase n=1 Tax=Pedobacter deserti TaxID=2817382 RepID=UPI00210B1813|nr:alpha-1,2-fucosyltransferase [Pedobacter sp. SYSU D00382]